MNLPAGCVKVTILSTFNKKNPVFAGKTQNDVIYTARCIMMTSSNRTFSALLALFAGNSPVTSEFPSQRPVTRSFDFFFICARINGWANNRKAGDLGRHSAHYDVSVMCNQHTVCSNELYINWCIPCNGQTEYHFISDEFVVKYRSHLIGNDDNDAKDIKPQYNDIINGKIVILVIE